MNPRRIKFRILIPVIYFVLALLPFVGMILTIAEGPNPFGFLFFVSEPGFRLLGLLNPFLEERVGDGLLSMLFVILVNAGIYFLVGYLIDFIIKRREST